MAFCFIPIEEEEKFFEVFDFDGKFMLKFSNRDTIYKFETKGKLKRFLKNRNLQEYNYLF